MKKAISVFVLFAMLISLFGTFTIGSSAEDENIRTATYTSVAPVLDGEIDHIWSGAKQLDFTDNTYLDGYSKVLWDESGLYILAVVKKLAYNDYFKAITFFVSETNGVESNGTEMSYWWSTDSESGNVTDAAYYGNHVWRAIIAGNGYPDATLMYNTETKYKGNNELSDNNPVIDPNDDAGDLQWSIVAKRENESIISSDGKTCLDTVVMEMYLPVEYVEEYRENDLVKLLIYTSDPVANKACGSGIAGDSYTMNPKHVESLKLVANSCEHTEVIPGSCITRAYCADCGMPVGELDPNNHEEEPAWTFTDETHGAVYNCCGTVYVTNEPHTWNDNYTATADNPPTCTEGGKEAIHCSVCNAVKAGTVRDAAALGHDFEDTFTVDKEATCEEAGSKSKHCSRCDAVSEVTEIPKLEHTPGEWTVVKKATCLREGLRILTCTQCNNDIQSEVIPKEAHTTGDWIVDAEAQVGVAGHRHKFCSVCNQIVDEEEIPALPAEESKGGCKSSLVSESGMIAVATVLLLATVCFSKKKKRLTK
ncbi:MAG: hypothetical protein ACI3XQ_01120 [Eubacteriales bacterium]